MHGIKAANPGNGVSVEYAISDIETIDSPTKDIQLAIPGRLIPHRGTQATIAPNRSSKALEGAK